jgi:hypothetical protein
MEFRADRRIGFKKLKVHRRQSTEHVRHEVSGKRDAILAVLPRTGYFPSYFKQFITQLLRMLYL